MNDSLPHNGLADTALLIAGVRAALQGLQWTRPDGVQVPAFEAVLDYDLQDLHTAIKELCVNKARICLVIYSGEDLDWEVRGRHLHLVRHQREISLLVADRNFGSRQQAFLGDGKETPGVLGLKDVVIGQLAGAKPLPGVVMMPVSGSTATVQNSQRADLYSRGAYFINFHLIGGDFQADLNQPPITGSPYSN